jgi:predicted lipoprotein with Yx(FWY)xxD motif
MRKPPFLAASILALIAATGAAATHQDATKAAGTTVVISTRSIPKLGTVLVNSAGRTLYMFAPDKQTKVTCLHSCAAVWPPVKLPKGAKPVAEGKAKPALLGSDPNPAGGRVVTYNHWPLYTYVVDTSPGQAKGQALNLNGGLWYVLSPTGKVIRTKP